MLTAEAGQTITTVPTAGPDSDMCMQMLFMVGPYLQAELGWKMFLGLYFVSGVAANVADYIGNVLVR